MRGIGGALGRWLPLALLLALMAILLGLGRSPAAVDWSEVRAVAFQSDDWGLCGFVPEASFMAGIDPQELQAGRFPAVYWGSTLEDSLDVARLQQILLAHRGSDGLPPVLQANYIVSSLHWRGSDAEAFAEAWERHDIPALPPRYQRPGMWQAVAAAIRSGVWRAELHGSFHYDPQMRHEAIRSSEAARKVAAKGGLLFPGSARAWELGPWRSDQTLTTELQRSLAIFTRAFGRPPVSVVAPDYVWDGRCENLWSRQGLMVIQGKREQRHPGRKRRSTDRLIKVLDRTLARLLHPDRVYLERNARLESVQQDSWAEVAAHCLVEIESAWQAGEPAVVETHRVNYAHTEVKVEDAGRQALSQLLESLGTRPLYLTDAELAQLKRSGTSWSLRGEQIIVRNLTHSRRLVALPEQIRGEAAIGLPSAEGGAKRLISLPPHTVRILTTD